MNRVHLPQQTVRGVPPTTVRECTDGRAWDDFVRWAPDSSVGHRWAWLDVVRRSYGHPVIGVTAEQHGRITGVLPLVLMRSRVFGRRLVSLPYLDCAGVCASGDPVAATALTDAAIRLADALHAPLVLRQRAAGPYPLPVSTHKVTMTLDLSAGEEAVWRKVRSNRRGQVRKAQRHGLTTRVGGAELVEPFHRVLARNMRDLGSPVHRRSFFRNTVEALGPDARILLVEQGDDVVGAALLLGHRDCLLMPFSSALRTSFSLGTNQLLYWEAIRLAVAEGYRTFDFGRSSPGSGTYEAKREWAAEPVPLHWYGVPPGDSQHPSRAGALAVSCWRRLPVPVATAVGETVRGRFPQ